MSKKHRALIQVFPSYLYRNNLLSELNKRSNAQFLPELLKECYQIREIDKTGQIWSAKNYHSGYTSYSSLSNLHTWSSSFELLEKRIRIHVHKYLESMGYDTKSKSVEMSNFWINIMNQHSTHSWHIHPHSVVSGTFYIQVPKSSPGIKFEDPRMNFMMSCLPKRKSLKVEQMNFIEIQPLAGEIVLFESWMRHEVPPNQSKMDRISASFNYGFY